MIHTLAKTMYTVRFTFHLKPNIMSVMCIFAFVQDFSMLVANPRKQKLYIQVKDSLGFTDLTIGTGEVNHLILSFYLIFFAWLKLVDKILNEQSFSKA